MISETKFSSGYSSFWTRLTPNSERFIRRVNLNLDRYGPPTDFGSASSRRGFLNEIAFRRFGISFPVPPAPQDGVTSEETQLIQGVRADFANLRDAENADLRDPTLAEWKEVCEISVSIYQFVRTMTAGNLSIVKVAPSFRGCGFIDACWGDILIDDRLFEVKAGDRRFRSGDIRQILTYCALNSVGREHTVLHVGCMNPRHRTFFSVNIDALCVELAGKSSTELLGEITYFISSGDTSR